MNLNTICSQNKQANNLTTPIIRVTPVNPYQAKQETDPNYNFYSFYNQLNMRRKAEVLSYKSSSQTNGLSKKMRYSQLTKGNYRSNTLVCPLDSSIPTPTSSSGVPGPVVYLYKDDTVPLYNYATNISGFTDINLPPSPEWKFFPIPDVACGAYKETTIAQLLIGDTVNSNYYTFNFSTPIAIYASGSDLIYSNFDISFSMTTSPTCSVYYSNNQLYNLNPVVNSPSYTVNIKGSSRNTTYGAYIYYGVVTVNNLILPTEAGFVYDIKMTFPLNIVPSNTGVGSNSFFTIYSNLQQDTYNSITSDIPNSYTPKECTIINNIGPSVSPYQPFYGYGA
jgi:hypothetical protein